MHLIRRPDWSLPERAAAPEAMWMSRRALLAGMGFGAFSAGLPAAAAPTPEAVWPDGAPATNPAFADAGRPVTAESITSKYNNFYEFGSHKQISGAAQKLKTDGWTVTIDGLVDREVTLSSDDLLARMPMEERVIRHRCVEAWSMVVPWIGFPLSALLAEAGPQAGAKYVRFEGFEDSGVAPGQRQFWYPWPYVEGLTVAEAGHPLAFMVMGAYGRVLHKQFGAPIRLHTPWKYGFKSIKSITRITLTEERPLSFWEELQAAEYGFWANVNPEVPHPRWSQATERDLATGERIPTHLFNGYADALEGLYSAAERDDPRFWR